ncbi:ABC transporter, multidrug-resistance, ATP-binding & transmembrane domain [Galdieria sulphuraria]|uniref:Probable ATP-dependent transporter ycf16 n=1 Tax=Galdieria sulphuraria TaxID=130081 RepID=M2XPP1_GALSU|nr:ABC transporter, multidrug-resistance, ATP-binding & transmembrane domain [Galdieria sulphuraria]EME32182.1 ABC transporter, multidrug-resistance, ATP-binding & transmembrane domain [Galdieria sulphuraria]|eukprot:XP_005708702.1 ABC transporter, multidrug-resistance, ATP-binding & transmembrane domain [Galdieria sulphuraria]
MATLWDWTINKVEQRICDGNWEAFILSRLISPCVSECSLMIPGVFLLIFGTLRLYWVEDNVWDKEEAKGFLPITCRIQQWIVSTLAAMAVLFVLFSYGEHPKGIYPPWLLTLSVAIQFLAWTLCHKLIRVDALFSGKGSLGGVPLLLPLFYLINAAVETIKLVSTVSYSSTWRIIASISPVLVVDYIFSAVSCVLCFTLLFISLFAPRRGFQAALPNANPEETASVMSLLSFSWLNPLFLIGYRRQLNPQDLYTLSKPLQNENVLQLLSSKWKQRGMDKSNALLGALYFSFWPQFWSAALLKLVEDLSVFAGPVLLQKIVSYVALVQRTGSSETQVLGFLYAFLIFLITMISCLAAQQGNFIVQKLYMCVTGGLGGMIYQKGLRLSNESRMRMTSGHIMTLVSSDAEKVAFYAHFFDLWDAPLKVLVSIGFLVFEVGWLATAAGFAVILTMIPINSFVVKKLGDMRHQLLHNTDERVRLVTEILQAIKIIKINAWEKDFRKKMNLVRDEELRHARNYMSLNFVNAFMFTVNPVLASVTCFIVYALLSPVLDVGRAFAALALFNNCRVPLNYLPSAIGDWMQATVAVRRIEEFMSQPELKGRDGLTYQITEENRDWIEKFSSGVVFEHCSFSWYDTTFRNVSDSQVATSLKKEEETPMLLKAEPLTRSPRKKASYGVAEDKNDLIAIRDITMRVENGSLVAVIGSVGSGKTSVLMSILGELAQLQGNALVCGRIAYAAQNPFIQHGTIRENVLFGREYEPSRYREALRVSALLPDLKELAAGDQTMLGIKGAGLSGGQKQRVSIARAVYADADIYVLDDILSAVDAHVATNIWDECIVSFLKNKVRIIAMNQINFIPGVDYVLLLDSGDVIWRGTPEEFADSQLELAKFLISDDISDADSASEALESYFSGGREDSLVEDAQQWNHENGEIVNLEEKDEIETEEEAKPSNLFQEEERHSGSIPSTVYLTYLLAYGGKLVLCALVFGFGFDVLSMMATDWWMGIWFSGRIQPDPGMKFYMSIYILIAFINAVVVLGRNVGVALGGLRSARELHAKLFSSIIRAPQRFFDTTPVGRIVNRFSKDQEVVDTMLPFSLAEFAKSVFQLAFIFLLIAFSTPPIVISLIVLLLLYYPIQNYYRHTFRELTRLEAVARSFVYSHFTESLDGAATVRAYDAQERFRKELSSRIDRRFRALFCTGVAEKWLEVRLNFLGTSVLFLSAVFAVADAAKISPALVGLSLSYALSITGILTWNVRQFAALEGQMIAVQRQLQFVDIPSEALPVIHSSRPPPYWPSEGAIVVDNLVVRYSENDPPVLKGISCRIRPREKVGIVGRTGAGKSSFFSVLLRLVEPNGGRIMIDGIDIATIGLYDLRSRLAVIAQEPVLFKGTIRSNMDPFGYFSDADLWEALRRVHMKETIANLPLGLDTEVSEDGSNFSAGQRQLICVARALLRRSKILLMDEATAAVDFQTDAMIQSMLRDEFAELTVLSIAHRLEDIITFDRVIVFDKGQIVEFDTPARLLEDPYTLFHSMVESTGTATGRHLKRLAKDKKAT